MGIKNLYILASLMRKVLDENFVKIRNYLNILKYFHILNYVALRPLHAEK